MEQKALFNQLQLACSPLTNYEFSVMRQDSVLERILQNASIYVIAQRPIISFENFNFNKDEFTLEFEIHQRENSNILICKLPLGQERIGLTIETEFFVGGNAFGGYSTSQPHTLHGFVINKVNDGKTQFVIWLTPEKLLNNWWRNTIECDIEGDFKSFLKYNVHYVGKATKQSILRRLSGHSTLQDILSQEISITYKDLPTHEISILCFEFNDNSEVQSFGESSTAQDIVAALRGETKPKQEKIFLDTEKALIKAMKPKYNREMFNNYPKSKDGLHEDNYDTITFTFCDPITLIYNKGKIEGSITPIGRDTIMIKNNTTFELFKFK